MEELGLCGYFSSAFDSYERDISEIIGALRDIEEYGLNNISKEKLTRAILNYPDPESILSFYNNENGRRFFDAFQAALNEKGLRDGIEFNLFTELTRSKEQNNPLGFFNTVINSCLCKVPTFENVLGNIKDYGLNEKNSKELQAALNNIESEDKDAIEMFTEMARRGENESEEDFERKNKLFKNFQIIINKNRCHTSDPAFEIPYFDLGKAVEKAKLYTEGKFAELLPMIFDQEFIVHNENGRLENIKPSKEVINAAKNLSTKLLEGREVHIIKSHVNTLIKGISSINNQELARELLDSFRNFKENGFINGLNGINQGCDIGTKIERALDAKAKGINMEKGRGR